MSDTGIDTGSDTGSQLSLPLPVRRSFRGDDFLVSDCNRDAAAMIDRWPDWPHHWLALVGPTGAGKTHLSHVWAERSNAQRLEGDISAAIIAILGRAAMPGALILDHWTADWQTLLHLYNATKEAAVPVLLVARQAPARWAIDLPDLASRLATVPQAGIAAPDDRLLAGVIAKQFADRQLRIADQLPGFLVRHGERSFAAAARMVDCLDSAALDRARPVTIPLARQILFDGHAHTAKV